MPDFLEATVFLVCRVICIGSLILGGILMGVVPTLFLLHQGWFFLHHGYLPLVQ